jgi:hypothetical protein
MTKGSLVVNVVPREIPNAIEAFLRLKCALTGTEIIDSVGEGARGQNRVARYNRVPPLQPLCGVEITYMVLEPHQAGETTTRNVLFSCGDIFSVADNKSVLL